MVHVSGRGLWVLVLNDTCKNISVILWRSVLLSTDMQRSCTAISAWFNSPTIQSTTIYSLINVSDENSVRNLDTPLIFKRALLSSRNEINNRSFLISVYLLHSKKKWNASSRGTPQAQFGLDTIFDLNKSLFKKEAL
jgi:hypothetical protein